MVSEDYRKKVVWPLNRGHEPQVENPWPEEKKDYGTNTWNPFITPMTFHLQSDQYF